jgi:hypothetical protein
MPNEDHPHLKHERTLQRAAAWPLVQRPYPRSMAGLERWIMRDDSEESLDDLFEALTADE